MKHQSGRSMVEILGVLAIIGLLSVGGLTAYNYAMDKKVVNDLMYDMELATTEIWTSGTTGPGGLNEKMDVSVLGENHPNITVRKLQHMENGEIVLDERDGEITEEDVAAVENGEQPAFSIEIHDITVAQCVQLLRNQDKLNTPFLLEDSDGNVFDPENGDDPQDFCERIFGGDDPVAFGLISNAYAKQSNTFVKKVLSIFYPETPEEKWQRELEDCAKQPKNTSPRIIKGRLCGFPDDCDCYNPAGYYFMKVGKECVKASVSKSGTSMFSSCVGSEEDRERAIEYIEKTKVKELTGMELVFKGVWFGPDDYDNPNSLSGFHAEYVFARVPCIIKDADGEKLVDYVSTRCLAFDPIKGTVYGNYQGCCPSGYVAQVGNSTLDNKITLMDGKFAECIDNSYCADKGEEKEYCNTWTLEPRCVPCPDGTDWITTTDGEGRGYAGVSVSKDGYACHCPTGNPVWNKHKNQCTDCPDGTDWITTTKGTEEKRGYVTGTSSNGYACHCPAKNPIWDGIKCASSCPDESKWMKWSEVSENEGDFVDGTDSNGYACYCPRGNPVWDDYLQECVSCPDKTKWMSMTEGKREARGFAWSTDSHNYACHCPADDPVWDGHLQKCTDCPRGTDWITIQEGKDTGRGLANIPDTNSFACHCPAENPIWDGTKCGYCPDETKWMTDTEGEGRGYADGTNSNDHACYCPKDKPDWVSGLQKCLPSCPDGTRRLTLKEGEGGDYVDGTLSEGYACHCPTYKPFWNKTLRQCVGCEEGQIYDGMGNCCDPETREGCKCTMDLLRNGAAYHVAKGDIREDQLINGIMPCPGAFIESCGMQIINGEVYSAEPSRSSGICPNQGLLSPCNQYCACPLQKEKDLGYCPCGENQVWNSEQWACLCEAGYVWNDDKTKCVQCSYPECFDKKEKGCRQVSDYEKNEDGYCVLCTTTDCKGNCDAVSDGNNGCTTCANVDPGKPYWDGDSCEECPFANQIWDAYNSVCVCADGYGLSEDGGCLKCTEYEYKNKDGYCVPCWEDKPVSDGNNYCTTCANVYWDRPYWDGDSCEPCPAEMPVWNGYSCQPCPEGTVYGQTSDGTMDCIEQETDTSNEERCMHYPETVWDGSRCVYCNEMPSCRPDGVGCTFESGRCV